jgi:SAM-dependent methyltransferase
MVAEANAYAAKAGVSPRATHHIADCTALPFAAGTFDACYCERVLQHLRDPAPSIAVAEALRVVKPGGRLAFVDTDWATIAINADEPELERRIAAAYPLQFSNPQSGRRLRDQLLSAGAADVKVELFRVVMDLDAAPWLMTATEKAALSRADVVRWRASLARSRAGGRLHGDVTLMLVTATTPRPCRL